MINVENVVFRFRPILPLLILLLTACTVAPIASPTDAPTSTPLPTAAPTALPPSRSPLQLEAAIYILDDDADRNSSARTVAEVADIYEKVNDIWAQADISIEVIAIERVSVPSNLLTAIAQRDFFAFFNAVNTGEVVLPEIAPIVGFYVRNLGGPNGIHPSNSNTFFVMDTPSVHDERVTSHEIGHIFGLHHALDDANRLLFSGTNGITLTEEEQAVARYSAQGILQRVR